MDDAREGKAYFHDPSHKGDKGKGKGKGKEMTPMPGLGDQLEQVQLEQIIDATAPPRSASAPPRSGRTKKSCRTTALDRRYRAPLVLEGFQCQAYLRAVLRSQQRHL